MKLVLCDWLLLKVVQFLERNGRLDRPQSCPANMYTLMHHCWSYAPADRPAFSEIHRELQMSTNYENVPLVNTGESGI